MKFSKLITVFAGALVVTTLLVACGTKKESNADNAKQSQTTKSEPKKIEVTDAKGKKLTVPTHPKKVVVFDNGSLDTINALGEGKSVAAVALKNLPPYLSEFKSSESAGGLKEPDLEKINAVQPDLIIISARQESFKKDLEKIAPVLYLGVDNAKVWESTKANIMTLASIYGKETEATKQVEDRKSVV